MKARGEVSLQTDTPPTVLFTNTALGFCVNVVVRLWEHLIVKKEKERRWRMLLKVHYLRKHLGREVKEIFSVYFLMFMRIRKELEVYLILKMTFNWSFNFKILN